jgi:signal peptidase I
MRFLRELLITIVLAIAVFLLLQTTVQTYVVIGASMEPNFQEDERLIITKIVYNFHDPEKGDVIIFQPPNGGEVPYIKRVIASPGDTVKVEDGVVYVNGQRLKEPYIEDPPKYDMSEREVPEDEYFVLGDARNNSNDSHNNWTVPRQNIIGKAWLAIWPPSKWGAVEHYPLQEEITSLTGN